jgi:ribosome maturation factor RimP
VAQSQIDDELQEEFSQIAARVGCELLHCEFVGGLLRLYLDRADGVNLDHCQTVSKQVSALLDVHDFGSGKYVLEVSSPGLNRRLFRTEDYERFQGRLVRVTWRDTATNAKQTVVGRLEAYRPAGDGELTLVDSTTGQSYSVSLRNIQLARLEPDI